MSAESFFATETVTEVVKVHPRFLDGGVRDHISARLRARYEDKCSAKGYFSPGSVEVTRVGAPAFEAHTLRGFVKFPVEFRARLFNPPEKAVVDATVKVINNFGILAVVVVDGREIMHIVVPRQIAALRSVIPDGVAVGDSVAIEIVRRKAVDGDGVLYGMGRIHNQGIALNDDTVNPGGVLTTAQGDAAIEDGVDDDVIIVSDEEEEDDVVSVTGASVVAVVEPEEEDASDDGDEVEVSSEEEESDTEEEGDTEEEFT